MGLNPLRRQLPSLSPVSAGSLIAWLRAEVGAGSPHEVLSELLRTEFQATDIVLTDSGTSALTLAIRMAMEISGRESVALPAYSCFDLATAVVGANATVIFYDLDPRTLGPAPDSLEAALSAQPAAVVAAPLFAVPFDSDEIHAAAKDNGALFIEDAAQGSGGCWRGKSLGSIGDLSILSFGRGKGRTGGGGGALLVRDDRVGLKLPTCRSLICGAERGPENLLKLMGQWAFGRPSLFWLPASIPSLGLGETRYREPAEIAEMALGPCAALLVNWERSRDEAKWRMSAGDRLKQTIEDSSDVETIEPPTQATAGWLRFPVVLGRPPAAEAVRAASRLGAARAYPTPLPDLPALSDRLIPSGSAVGAMVLAERLWTLPTHSMTCVDEAAAALRLLCQD